MSWRKVRRAPGFIDGEKFDDDGGFMEVVSGRLDGGGLRLSCAAFGGSLSRLFGGSTQLRRGGGCG